jgi:hypothetical protein
MQQGDNGNSSQHVLATKGKHHDTKPCLACITTASMIRLQLELKRPQKSKVVCQDDRRIPIPDPSRHQQDARKAQAHKPSKAQMPSKRQQHDCVLNATNDQQASQTQETNVSKLAMIEETQSLRHSRKCCPNEMCSKLTESSHASKPAES